MSSSDEIEQKIVRLCSYVCNGKFYRYEQRLHLATKHELYDSAIIYAWNIFMLFVYEKIWQLREIEKESGTVYKTDKIFRDALAPKEQDNYFDGNLFSLNRLQTEHGKGEEAIIGKLKDVYKSVDQQWFKKAQNVLGRRNEKAHINSLGTEKEDLEQVLRELIQICAAIQMEHNDFISKIFEFLEKKKEWHISDEDMRQINYIFSTRGSGVDKLKYIHVANLIVEQEFSPETTKNIKDRAIQYFLEPKGFCTSEENASEENAQLLIKPLIAILDQNDIKKIIVGSFDNDSHGYNQILQAVNIEDIFIELHALSRNNFPELEKDWKEFIYKTKTDGYQNNFMNLIQEIEFPSENEYFSK